MEPLHGQQFGDVRPLIPHRGRDLGELAVLLGQFGRGCDLDLIRVLKRPLGEGGEPPERLDLVAEEVDPNRPLLGGREDVEQSATDRELAAIFYLLNPLIPGRDEVMGDLVEVEQLALSEDEAVRAQRGVGNLLRERHRADDDDRRAAPRLC